MPQTLDDLARANCLKFFGNGRSTWLFQNRGRQQRIAVNGNLECNHGIPAIAACVAGVGIGQFLRYQVADHLAAGRLQEILHAYALPPQPISAVYPHAGMLPSRVSIFIDWIKKELRETENHFTGHAESNL